MAAIPWHPWRSPASLRLLHHALMASPSPGGEWRLQPAGQGDAGKPGKAQVDEGHGFPLGEYVVLWVIAAAPRMDLGTDVADDEPMGAITGQSEQYHNTLTEHAAYGIMMVT